MPRPRRVVNFWNLRGHWSKGKTARACKNAPTGFDSCPMSKSLIITEKPSVASDIAKALGGFKKGKDHYENEQCLLP